MVQKTTESEAPECVPPGLHSPGLGDRNRPLLGALMDQKQLRLFWSRFGRAGRNPGMAQQDEVCLQVRPSIPPLR